MAKPTKKDVASRIVTAFPDAGFDSEWLVEENTLAELLELETKLEKGGAVEQADSADEPLYELGEGFKHYFSNELSLVEGEKKPLPEHPSQMLLDRIVRGHIVPVKKG